MVKHIFIAHIIDKTHVKYLGEKQLWTLNELIWDYNYIFHLQPSRYTWSTGLKNKSVEKNNYCVVLLKKIDKNRCKKLNLE